MADPRSARLTAHERSHFAAALREQRRFRLEQVAQLAEARTAGSNPYGSPEVTAALTGAATHALAEIEAALARLRDGSYGRCTGCGQQIIRERLEVLPAAALCMACQHRAAADHPAAPVSAGASRRRPG